jgi:ketosteroid isomerase-like protein
MVFCATLGSLASIRAADPSADEQQLRKLEQDWAESYVKRDPSFAQKNMTDDFTFIGPEGNMVNKADYIKGVTGPISFTQFKIDDLRIRTYGDTAVVLGLATITAKTGEKDESGQYSFTDVFVKQKNEWKAASGQVTAVVNPKK